MKFLIFCLLPLTCWAVNRSSTIDAPAFVYHGASVVVPAYASTDATDGELMGFFHAEYSTDGGASWNGAFYDVNVASPGTRNFYVTAGAPGSTIVLRTRVAFREGAAGDVDYNGDPIDWSGSWDNSQTPPTVYAYIPVVALPNVSPEVNWIQNPSSAYIGEYFPMQSRGNDASGNLSAVYVWKDWVPFAFNGGGNGFESYSDPNLAYGTSLDPVNFQTQAYDSDGAYSAVIFHSVTMFNRDPGVSLQFLDAAKNPLPINGSGRAQTSPNSVFYIRVMGTDPDGNLQQIYSRINTPNGAVFSWEQIGAATTSTIHDFGPYNTGNNNLGIWNAWAHAADATSGAYQWEGGGWKGTDAPDLEVVNQPPTGSFTLNGSAANASVLFGQSVAVSSTATDADGNLTFHSIWWDQGTNKTWTHPVLTGSYPPSAAGWENLNLGSDGYVATGGNSSRSFDFRATKVGSFVFRSATGDPQSTVELGAWRTVTVGKATPVITFANRDLYSLDPSYAVKATDLNAILANPHSTGVAAPSGGVSYSIVGSGAVVSPGTSLVIGQTYTIRASYAGDVNYLAATKDAVWTIHLHPHADFDGDGMANVFEQQYFGSPTASHPDSLASADPDGDGFTNVAEYNLGTNPTVANAGSSSTGNTILGGWPSAQVAGATTYAVGATTGSLSVDKSGAATYSVPIWVSPGRAGMQPQLSLNYSAQSGNGIAGFGWSLSGISMITRGPQTKTVDNQIVGLTATATDRFYLDGQRLILIAGTYGAAGSEYRTENDTFTKVIAYGTRGSGPEHFKAWTKAGLVIEFGNTDESAYDAFGKPEALWWSVNKISDTTGHNTMTFTYEENAADGVQRLTRIDYPHARHVEFEYEDRLDIARGYVAGAPVSNLKRLKEIRSYNYPTKARSYRLNYTNRTTASPRSLLTSITEKGMGDVAYPDLVFSYEEPQGGWAVDYAYSTPHLFAVKDNQQGAGLMDLDSDGRPDFVRKKQSNSGTLYSNFYRNTGTGWQSLADYLIPGVMALAWDGRADAGARFADLDGDGLVDVIFSTKNSNGTVSNYAYRNTGTGWDYYSSALLSSYGGSPYPSGTVYLAQHGQSDTGRRLIDVNGDGLPDLVWNSANNGSNKGCLLNNSDGRVQSGGPFWVRNDAWAPPFPLVESVSSGAQMMDVNGDGLPDIVRHGLSQSGIEIAIALNTPTGWVWAVHPNIISNSTPYSTYSTYLGTLGKYLPPTILSKDGAGWTSQPMGTEVVDLNGDGLVDVLMSNPKANSLFGTPRAYLNTGDGWVSSSAYAPPAGVYLRGRTTGDEIDPTGAVLMDINGDGLVDIAVCQVGQAPLYYLNTGQGWGSANTSYLPSTSLHLPYAVASSDPTVPTGTQFADLNGDGIADIISNSGPAYINQAKPLTDRLIKVTNGMGAEASIAYKSLLDATVYTKESGGPAGAANLVGPMYVVSTITHDDGAGGTYPVTYKYSGLRSHWKYGSLGFASMTVTDGRKSIDAFTRFSQEYPFVGMPIEQRSTYGSIHLSETLTAYGEKPLNSNKTRFIFAQDTITTTRDLTNAVIRIVDTSIPALTDIDDYGNVKKLIVDTSGYVKTTESSYVNDTTNWFLGRLSSSAVTSSMPSGYGQPDITRISSFTYYPTTGLLHTETVEPGDATLELTTTYGYDIYGNKTSVAVSGAGVTIANASGALATSGTVTRTTTTTYDWAGGMPASTTNSVGHTEFYVYHPDLGVITSLTGANGLVTQWEHDAFGRVTKEIRADGTATETTYRWTNGSAPTAAKYFVETTHIINGTSTEIAPPSMAYHDKFGRAFLGLSVAGDGQIVYQATAYDAQGRAYATSVPYFAGSPVYWATTTSFDVLDRPLASETPDEEAPGGKVTQTFDYAGTHATVTDGRGRISRTVTKPTGWTQSVNRNETSLEGAPSSSVAYGYDPLGNLLTTNADGVVTSIAYDLRGRKTQMVDPDMGTWHYRYNIFGELIWQKDAKGNITTLSYDALGRLVTRLDGAQLASNDPLRVTTTWTYDTSAKPGGGVWKGKLYTVSLPGYSETHTYDALGRPSVLTRTIGGTPYAFTQTYDSVGRPRDTQYPTGFTTRNLYNNYGFLKEIRRADGGSNLVYWMAQNYSATGRIDSEIYGNGLANDRVYSQATGRLKTATIGKAIETGPLYSIQNLAYTYDQVGNVLTRTEGSTNRSETFTYDGLDRLKTHALSGSPTVSVTYHANGNIATKSDVGTYAYDSFRPHALTGISGGAHGNHTYSYDPNGNMTGGGGRAITWTSFNQIAEVSQGGQSSAFTYGANRERIVQNSTSALTVYVGSLYEKVTPAGQSAEHKHYIMGPTGRIAVHTTRSTGIVLAELNYFHTDGLGSITAVTNEKGAVVKRFAFDAWGKRLDPATGNAITPATNGQITRGYTDHEHLDAVGLVHMNGRVYDPTLGRFLSADPNVDGVEDAQGYNRYSYVGNNPLGATDPTGFFSLKDALKIVAIIVVGVVTAGAALAAFTPLGFAGGIGAMFGVAGAASLTLGQAIIAGAAFGFGSSFAGSLLNGGSIGDAFKAGLIGAVVGGISAGIAHGIGTMAKAGEWGWELKAAAHGVAQGGITEATGGQFRHGFYAGFFASAAGGKIDGIGEGKNWGSSARVAASAVVGGTASAIGGGKFANGAVSGAFVRLFNEEMHSGKKDYRAYYLLNKDSHTGDAVHGHAAALVEDPTSGKYLLFSQAARFGRPMQMRPFDSIDDAMSSVFARQYESAIEFRMTADQATAAIRVGMKYLDSWLYDPTGLLFADNCASASCKILNAGGAGLAYGRQSSIPFILPNSYGPPIPMQAISPTEVFRVNAGRVGQTMKFGTH